MRTSGSMRSQSFAPTEEAARPSSSEQKPPNSSLRAISLAARAGPIPGKVVRSGASARLRSTEPS